MIEPQELIRSFVEKKLDGDIEKIASFVLLSYYYSKYRKIKFQSSFNTACGPSRSLYISLSVLP